MPHLQPYQPEGSPVIPLPKRIPAYVDSSSAGLVPCVAIAFVDCGTFSSGVRVRITATRGGYWRGEELTVSLRSAVPRTAVRKFRSSPFPKILPYSWRELAGLPSRIGE